MFDKGLDPQPPTRTPAIVAVSWLKVNLDATLWNLRMNSVQRRLAYSCAV